MRSYVHESGGCYLKMIDFVLLLLFLSHALWHLKSRVWECECVRVFAHTKRKYWNLNLHRKTSSRLYITYTLVHRWQVKRKTERRRNICDTHHTRTHLEIQFGVRIVFVSLWFWLCAWVCIMQAVRVWKSIGSKMINQKMEIEKVWNVCSRHRIKCTDTHRTNFVNAFCVRVSLEWWNKGKLGTWHVCECMNICMCND